MSNSHDQSPDNQPSSQQSPRESTPNRRASDRAGQVTPGINQLAPGGSVVDRRMWPDRRGSIDSDTGSGLERRRGVGRRLSDFTKSAEEGQLTPEQFLFLMAIDTFKKVNDRGFPTWTDVLEVIRLLGYRKTMPSELTLPNAEDWMESAASPSNVRPPRWAERFRKPEDRNAA